MNRRQALDIVGGLSRPHKMPCSAWGVPPEACDTGSILRAEVPNSVCARCYAHKGHGVQGQVKRARARRLAAWRAAPGAWVDAMVRLVRGGRSGFFRWFDSGDVQGMGMLFDIVGVARDTPQVKHWLPTMEGALVRRALAMDDELPSNLCIRITSPRVDMLRGAIGRLPRSVVVSSADKLPEVAPGAYPCPATFEPGRKQCLDCRACWDPEVLVVAYLEH